MGVIDIKTTERNGKVLGAVQVQENDEVMLITNSGTLIRTAVEGISTLGRNTQGVRLIRTSEEEKLVRVVRVVNEDDDEEGEGATGSQDSGPDVEGGTDSSGNSVVDGDREQSGDTGGDAAEDSEDE